MIFESPHFNMFTVKPLRVESTRSLREGILFRGDLIQIDDDMVTRESFLSCSFI